MYKIIGADGNEYGPETDDQVRQWIAEGRADGRTLVQPAGSSRWERLANLPEFAEALASAPVPSHPTGAHRSAVSPQILRVGDRGFSISDCMGSGLSLLTANFGLLLGATFLIGALDLAARMIPLVHPFVTGVLYGGLYLVYLRRIRGEPTSVAEAFTGFGPSFVQLLLTGFLTGLLTAIGYLFCVLPGLFLIVSWIFSVALAADKRLEFWAAMEASRKAVAPVWFRVFALIVAIFSPFLVSYLYVLHKAMILLQPLLGPFIHALLDGDVSAAQKSMESIMQVAHVIGPLSLMSQAVLLINLPFAVASLMYAYEALFGARSTPTA
jgi:hypothetical protein